MSKKYLFADDNYQKIIKKVKNAENILLFLDYDGTLAPFNSDPLKAKMLPQSKENLKRLIKQEKYKITFVSGRKLNELKKMLNFKNLNFAGSHGIEVDLSFRKEIIYPQKDNIINQKSKIKYQKIKEKYSKSEEVELEDKGFGLAIHLESENKKKKFLEKIDSLFKNSDYQVLAGRKIIELRPIGWDKGKAVNYISRGIQKFYQLENFLRIYIGDDSTDEDAFEVLNDGIRIYVKNNSDLKTKADYYLKNPADTAKLLKKLAGGF